MRYALCVMRFFMTKNKIILTICLASLFGLFAGVVGALIAKVYIFNEIPYLEPINLSSDNYSRSNLIIRGAKKVIVSQDIKVEEIINSTYNSIVGIFKKNADNYYQLNNEMESGLIITSDGWIIANALPENSKNEDFIIITRSNEIYNIDKIIKDKMTSFDFIHVQGVKDFSVKSFSDIQEIKNGQLVMTASWKNENYLTSIAGRLNNSKLVKSSDSFSDELVLTNNFNETKDLILFNLNGQIVGLRDKNNIIRPITHFQSAIQSLLKNQKIQRPILGVYYINLSDIISKDIQYKKGAMIRKNNLGISIIKNSPADSAGLREGDIITTINNTELNKNNNLTYIIQNYSAEDSVTIEYLRNNEKKKIEVKLGAY